LSFALLRLYIAPIFQLFYCRFSRIADIENKQQFLALLPASGIRMVASSLGELFKFDPSHPTGHYKLDLADNYQFMLAQKLQACCLSSALFLCICMRFVASDFIGYPLATFDMRFL
jgi:hypothetical protein